MRDLIILIFPEATPGLELEVEVRVWWAALWWTVGCPVTRVEPGWRPRSDSPAVSS